MAKRDTDTNRLAETKIRLRCQKDLLTQAREAEAKLAQEVEQHIDAEFKKCVDLATLHSTGLLELTKFNKRAPMPLQLPPRFQHLIPAGPSHVRLASSWLPVLSRAGSTGQG